jgi:DNA-binding transcriptional LysR family regulator
VLIRHLEYLVALARERHFARAALACNVTQPALSAGIKHLEESLGVPIVERDHRFQGLTPDGERVLAWARRVLVERDALIQEIGGVRGGLVGRLRIGGIPVALPVLSLLTTPFATRHPRVRITVASLTSVEIQRGLDEFALDVGLTYLDNEPLAHVRTIPLYLERYVLVTPRDGPFAGRASVTWQEAVGLRLCLLTPAMQYRRILDAYFREAGTAPDPVLETNSLVTLASHVRQGTWSTILPHTIRYVIGESPDLQIFPLVEPIGVHQIGVIVPDRDPIPPVVAALTLEAQTIDIEAALGAERAGRRLAMLSAEPADTSVLTT